MSFSAEWLALREPYDSRARNRDVLEAVAAAVKTKPAIAVVDLACGTGSTLRAISGCLPERQDWRLVDNNLSLLARAAQNAPNKKNRVVRATPVDLAHDLEAALDGPVDLVTTSALLDLVSAEWLDRMVTEAAARHLPVYAALSYDGRVTFDPADPLDEPVIAAVNQHQRTDKGFGPALGPLAAATAVARFKAAGYAVVEGHSDWRFSPRDREIQLDMLSGWAGAAREIGKVTLPDAAAWLTRRRDHVSAGRSTVTVGHVDFFAWPMGTRQAERSQSNRTSSPSG